MVGWGYVVDIHSRADPRPPRRALSPTSREQRMRSPDHLPPWLRRRSTRYRSVGMDDPDYAYEMPGHLSQLSGVLRVPIATYKVVLELREILRQPGRLRDEETMRFLTGTLVEMGASESVPASLDAKPGRYCKYFDADLVVSDCPGQTALRALLRDYASLFAVTCDDNLIDDRRGTI